MNLDTARGILLRVRTSRKQHSQDTDHNDVRYWMILVHVSFIKLLNFALAVELVPWYFFEGSVVNVFLKVS